ncbi:MFS transporter [Microbacterium sp. KUDC0406]|uniref:MFS transporter n=1 Tax=Microbacterium sp. KUDC0406 TaxID=2909588 RepID=UPI001F40974B|nr:MFS transporter [Microbacterium sp. KUDC0406]UJP11541.1 MFS transporter [Microbacterium sp. KUDC0406]
MTIRSTSRRAYAAIAVSVASIALLQNLVIPVIPMIESDLHVASDAATWTMTAWLIAAAVATPLLGRIGDLRGRRTTLLAVLAVVMLGNLVAALAPNIGVLILGRVLQGAGGAVFPLAFALLREVMPPQRLTGAIGSVSALVGIGGAAGSVLAGPLSAAIGWRGLFEVALVAGAVGALLTVAWIPRSGLRTAGRLNSLSAVLLSGWLVALLLPLASGAHWGWASPVTLGMFALAAVLLAAWVISELRSAVPLVDIRMLAHRDIWPVNAAGLLIGVAVFGFWGYLPLFLEVPADTGWALGLTVQTAGLVLVPLLIGMSVAGFATGPLTRVLALRRQLVLGALLMGATVIGAVLFHSAVWQLALAGGLFGVGVGTAYAAMASIIVESVPAGSVGIATGVNANLRSIGSAIGSALMTAIVFGTLDPAGRPLERGYDVAWVTIAVLAVVAAAIVAIVPAARRRDTAPVQLPTGPQTVLADAA